MVFSLIILMSITAWSVLNLLVISGAVLLIYLEYHWLGWPLAVLALGVGCYRIYREVRLENEVMECLRGRLLPLDGQRTLDEVLEEIVEKLEDYEDLSLDDVMEKVKASGDQFGLTRALVEEFERASELPDDVVRGSWHRCEITATMHDAQLVADVVLPVWPAEMGARKHPAPLQGPPTTGDQEFDQEVLLEADEAHWRSLLTHKVRKKLVVVLSELDCTLDAPTRTVTLRVPRFHLREAEGRLEQVAFLGQELARITDSVDEPHERVLTQLDGEPSGRVRLGHFEWLRQGGWEMQRVLQRAEADPDPLIQRWAEEQRVGEGMYR